MTGLLAAWPGERAAIAISDTSRVVGFEGDIDWVTPVASVTKLFTAYAALIAVEEGSITLDDPAGPQGSTVRHLLAHASGLAFDDDRVDAAVGSRRVYSNVGIEVLADHIAAATEMTFDAYVRVGVLEPLGLDGVMSGGSAAHGMSASVDQLLVFGRELLSPTLVHPDTVALATTPVFGELKGVLPGFGSHDPNPWGLGFEIRGDKTPHWTSTQHWPRTFGHFGGAGSFLWVDPDRRLVGASVCDTAFGPWAVDAWPVANTSLLARFG